MKIKYVLAIGIALIATVALLGPRVDMNISLDDLTLTDNLDLYLSKSESRFDDITEGRHFNCFFPWLFCHPARVIALGGYRR